MSKSLFQRTVKAVQKSNDLMFRLSKQEERRYGYTHNDLDLDTIIDAVDYGCGNLSDADYHKLMIEAVRWMKQNE